MGKKPTQAAACRPSLQGLTLGSEASPLPPSISKFAACLGFCWELGIKGIDFEVPHFLQFRFSWTHKSVVFLRAAPVMGYSGECFLPYVNRQNHPNSQSLGPISQSPPSPRHSLSTTSEKPVAMTPLHPPSFADGTSESSTKLS